MFFDLTFIYHRYNIAPGFEKKGQEMTQEEKREARENKLFSIAFIGMFLLIPTGVIGYNIVDWAQRNDIVKNAQQKTKAVKQKIISFTEENSKINKR